jgi:hypothetical protein
MSIFVSKFSKARYHINKQLNSNQNQISLRLVVYNIYYIIWIIFESLSNRKDNSKTLKKAGQKSR